MGLNFMGPKTRFMGRKNPIYGTSTLWDKKTRFMGQKNLFRTSKNPMAHHKPLLTRMAHHKPLLNPMAHHKTLWHIIKHHKYPISPYETT